MSSPTTSSSSDSKSSYAGAAWQMMYNAKAAVSQALRKELKQMLDSSNIHALGQVGQGEDWLQRYCKTIQYFSYRNKLPVPIGTQLDHDAGWGCMVRTGQMMLCVALKRSVKILHGKRGRSPSTMSTVTHIDGEGNQPIKNTSRNNQRQQQQKQNSNNDPNLVVPSGAGGGSANNNNNMSFATNNYTEFCDLSAEEQMQSVVNMFRDIPQADFSIHAIVNAGSKYHIQPGEWFNATSLALSLKHLILMRDNCPITAVHGMESTVQLNDIMNAAGTGKPILVMVSVMPSMNNISPTYFPAVHECLGHETSVGIVGGKPKKSMYFFASQKETLFMLDPHYVQPAFTQKTPIGLSHGNMDWVPMSEADSSMLLCFLLEPREDAIESWAQWVETKLPPLSEYPLFSISRRKPKSKTAASGGAGGGTTSKAATAAANTNNNASFSAPRPKTTQKSGNTPTLTSSKPPSKQQSKTSSSSGGGTKHPVALPNDDDDDFDTCDDDFLDVVDSNTSVVSSSLPNNKNAHPVFNSNVKDSPPLGPSRNVPVTGGTGSGVVGLDPALDALLGGPAAPAVSSSSATTAAPVQKTSSSNNNNQQPQMGFDDL